MFFCGFINTNRNRQVVLPSVTRARSRSPPLPVPVAALILHQRATTPFVFNYTSPALQPSIIGPRQFYTNIKCQLFVIPTPPPQPPPAPQPPPKREQIVLVPFNPLTPESRRRHVVIVPPDISRFNHAVNLMSIPYVVPVRKNGKEEEDFDYMYIFFSYIHNSPCCGSASAHYLDLLDKKLREQQQKREEANANTARNNVVTNIKKKQVQSNAATGKEFNHPWLVTSLKGHSSRVLDMDYSANGKYLATCGEVNDPGGGVLIEEIDEEEIQIITDDDSDEKLSDSGCSGLTSGNSSSNASSSASTSGEDESSSSDNKSLSRRQRKRQNRCRHEDNSPSCQRNKNNNNKFKKDKQKQLQAYIDLDLADTVIYSLLLPYLLSFEDLILMGYPVESSVQPTRAVIYKKPHTSGSNNYYSSKTTTTTVFDVNAPEFIPGVTKITTSYQQKQQYSVSKQCVERPYYIVYNDVNDPTDENEKTCVRCGAAFHITSTGKYLTHEKCTYHYGKLQRIISPDKPINTNKRNAHDYEMAYDCCNGRQSSPGCTTGKLHVWNGLNNGLNGPFEGYVRTKLRKTAPHHNYYGVYSLDCEMCYTASGLEVAEVCVIAIDGKLAYYSLVKTESPVIDYNTRFSGIDAAKLSRATKSLREVQNDLMGFINADTILIGHSLENDLRALKLIHTLIIDTAVSFPCYTGSPLKRSLKSLISSILCKNIQNSPLGHDCMEDAKACVELILWRLNNQVHPNRIK